MSEEHLTSPTREDANDSRSSRREHRARYRSSRGRLVSSLAKFALLAYAMILAVLVLMEPRLVYPGAYEPEPPADGGSKSAIGPAIKTVQYQTTDQVTLNGRLLERANARDALLYFHGNGTQAIRRDDRLRRLSAAFDATVMAAEYRGYADDLTPTEQGVLNDCFAARDFFCDRTGKTPDELILYGQSLGGGCAVAVASMGGAHALVLESTFDRMVDVAANRYPLLPVRWLMRNRFDSIAKITVYKGPLIQTHGSADRTIPISHAKRLFEASPSTLKHWIELPGKSHNEGLSDDMLATVVAKIREFTGQPETSGSGPRVATSTLTEAEFAPTQPPTQPPMTSESNRSSGASSAPTD